MPPFVPSIPSLPLPLLLLLLLLIPHLPTLATASATNSTTPKRGLTYISTAHSSSDDRILTNPRSPLTWYYNYSPNPNANPFSSLSFVPMIPSASVAHDAVSTIESLDSVTHVLTFNEPDGSTGSGGTNTTPSAAAQIWLNTIAPLRQPPHNLSVGLPATTGSSSGLTWLRAFNASCHTLSDNGCPFDFIATHFYGDLPGLQSWLSQIHDIYPAQKIWLTEFAVPGVSATDTLTFMNDSLQYLDGLDYVERYAWFGAFRTTDANAWTGSGVSIFDGGGKLTELGATYLGGAADGFEEGQSSAAAVAVVGVKGGSLAVLVFTFAIVMTIMGL